MRGFFLAIERTLAGDRGFGVEEPTHGLAAVDDGARRQRREERLAVGARADPRIEEADDAAI